MKKSIFRNNKNLSLFILNSMIIEIILFWHYKRATASMVTDAEYVSNKYLLNM